MTFAPLKKRRPSALGLRPLLRLAPLLLTAALCRRAGAWAAGGHAVVAEIAYQELSPAERARATGILAAHPAAAEWAEEKPPPGRDAGEVAFLRASAWPDQIRRHGSPYDHPAWHYVDYPLLPSYKAVPSNPVSPAPDDDVLFGIAQSERTLGDRGASPVDRAAALAWLIHLVGDIHQPLHCATLVVPGQLEAPVGDKGGNRSFIRYGDRASNLHTFWDDQFGVMANPTWAAKQAAALRGAWAPAALPELATDRTPRSWSQESLKLALADAYGSNLPLGTDLDHASPVTDAYVAQAKLTSARQITLAGYRLASEIRNVLQAGA